MTNWVYPFQERDYYTVTTTCYEPPSYENVKRIKYFNCKRCGAVEQQGVCEYCGSAEEGEPDDNT